MSAITSTETKPEIVIRKLLFARGYRYRKNVNSLPGKPDIVLRKYNTIIFVNGCFWHGHKNCKASALPQTRRKFWEEKIGGNIERDKKNISILKRMGWKVVIVWQCNLSNKIKREKELNKVIAKIKT